MRLGRSGFIAVLILICLTTSCARNQLKRAQQYELEGNYSNAIHVYQDALAHLPEHDAPARSQILMKIGECLYRTDRPQEAFSSFHKATEADPNNATAHLRIGELLLSAGAPDQAREQATIVLRANANNSEALSLLGASWAASDNNELAKRAYQQALQSDPARVTVAVALADIYNRQDDVAKAEAVLQQAAAAQPHNALPWLAMARLQEQEGRSQAAEAAYRKAISLEDTPETNMRLAQFLQRSARVSEAEQTLRKVDSERQSDPFALADFQLLSGRLDDALQQYRTALDNIRSPAPSRKRWFLISKSRNSAQSAGRNDNANIVPRMIEAQIMALPDGPSDKRKQAISTIRGQLQENRARFDSATASILEAELAIAENNLTQARWFAKAATELSSGSAAAHYVAGLVASAADDTDTAEAEWQNALEQDPHFSPARLSLAEDALARGDGEEADEQAREVVREDPGDLQAILIFARALLLEGKTTAAAIMAQRASALSPTSPEPAIILGQVSLKLGNLPNALLSFERALLVNPDSEEGINGLLEVYRKGTPSYASIRKMEQVAQDPPISGALLEIAGRLYADHGWYTDAMRALAKTVELDPRRKSAARTLAQLQDATGDFALASVTAEKLGVASQPLLSAYRQQNDGNWQQAISTYERALRDGDQSGVAANNVAWLYAEHHAKLDRALALAESAAQRSPNNPAILDTLGFVHMQRREYTDAVKFFETAARLATVVGTMPEDRALGQQIHRHLTEAYMRTGQTEAALRPSKSDSQLAR